MTSTGMQRRPWFTCGATGAGTTYCWGMNGLGQLGNGTFAPASTPSPVSGGHAFVRITAGGGHACGADGSGAAWCWGTRASGRLGDGYADYDPLPALVTGMPASAGR